MIEQTPYTVYILRFTYHTWITTDISEMTRFCIFMDELGNADTDGTSKEPIPLISIT